MLDLDSARWRTSSYSSDGPNCVQVAFTGLAIGVRDSKNITGPLLAFSAAEWRAFVGSIAE